MTRRTRTFFPREVCRPFRNISGIVLYSESVRSRCFFGSSPSSGFSALVVQFIDKQKGERIKVDVPLDKADEARYDALMLPGGVKNPDMLRMDEHAVAFVRRFFEAGKPIAAICHGPWLLAEADVLKGRTVTSWRSIRTDLINAGATWVDQQVVTDEGLVTSRQPADIPAFSERFIEEIREGRHDRQAPQRAA
jgi:protease I